VEFALEVAGRIFGCSGPGALRLRRPLHDVTGCLFARSALSPSNRARQHHNECAGHGQKLGMHNNLHLLRKPCTYKTRPLSSVFRAPWRSLQVLCRGEGNLRRQGAQRGELRRRGKDDGARGPGGAGGNRRELLDDVSHRRHVAGQPGRLARLLVSMRESRSEESRTLNIPLYRIAGICFGTLSCLNCDYPVGGPVQLLVAVIGSWTLASSKSRIRAARPSCVIGFWIIATPGSSRPWWTMAFRE